MSSISKLRSDANRIANETVEGANTASRIGALYLGIIDFLDVLNGKEYTYDDTELRAAIDRINRAIADLDSVIADASAIATQERDRLNDLLEELDTRIRGKVNDMLDDAAVIESHAAIIQLGLEGKIQWQSGWDEKLEQYLLEVGVWARNGNVIKTQWTLIVQAVDNITSTVAEVQQDLSGRPTMTLWSEIVLKANSIEQTVNALIRDGNIPEALQSSISLTVDNKIASLNLETMYAKVDTEGSKEVLEWMYSALKNESSADKTFNQLVSAGKSGINNGISEVRTYVEIVKNGDVLDYVAYSDLESKVNDSITGLYNKATADSASTTIFSQVKRDSLDIAAIVTSATGDYTSASIATKFQNWKAGLIIRSEFNSAIAELVTHNELSGAVAGFVLLAYVDEAVANLVTRISNATAAVNLKATLDGAYGELVTAWNLGDKIDGYLSGFITLSDLEGAMATMVAKSDYKAATIVAMVNNAASSVSISADHISLKGGTLSAWVDNFEVKASDIKFIAGDSFDWTVEKDGNTIFHLDSDGNLTISGTFNGLINDNVSIGTGDFIMKIVPRLYNYASQDIRQGAALVGEWNGTEIMSLGFGSTLSRNYKGLYMTFDGNTAELSPSYLTINRSNAFIDVGGLGLIRIGHSSSSGLLCMGYTSGGKVDVYISNYSGSVSSNFYNKDNVSVGHMYLDEGFLKIKT